MSKQAMDLAKQLVSVLEAEQPRLFYKNGDLPHAGDTISHNAGQRDDWLVLDTCDNGRVRAQTLDRSTGKFYPGDTPALLSVGEYYLVDRAVLRHADGSRIKVGDMVEGRKVATVDGMHLVVELSAPQPRRYIGGEEFMVGDVAQNQKSKGNWIITSVYGNLIKGYPQESDPLVQTVLNDPYKLIGRAGAVEQSTVFTEGALVQHTQTKVVARITKNTCFCGDHYTVRELPEGCERRWQKDCTVLIEPAPKQ